MIHEMCSCGNPDSGYQLLKVAQNSGIKMSVFSYNLVLQGFCCEMRLQEADGVLFDMGNQGITPDRDLSRALSFLYEMVSRGVKPNCIIMSFLIQRFCKMGAGFGSKFNYGSGFFQMKMKIPKRDCAGVVTTFYLSSNTDQHDELDFEFLGNREGKPYLLQTNVFANGVGNREQRIQPWFDPSESFHDYKILWNPYQIVFFVDDIPIRVFKNKTSNGVKYPSKPMQILSSLWDGEDWATDGGKEKTDWTQAPFIASYQGFSVDGCRSSDWEGCSSSSFWWNSAEYSSLSPAQEKAYEDVKNYVTYDYCSDRPRFPTPPPECPQ